MQKNTFGKAGEIIACNYLKQKGYKIIGTNVKNLIGEIDIIAKDNKTLIFVEVKTRASNAFGSPLEAIDQRKQHKIRQVATMWQKQHKQLEAPSRFDAISIVGFEEPEITHIIDAF